VAADLVNLGHIEDDKGVKILGLLGANLFTQMEMEIDVAHDVLYLYKLDKNGERLTNSPESLPKAGLEIPIDVEGSIVFVNATVGGTKLHFCFDSGAEINVLSNSVPKKVLQMFHLKSRNSLIGSGNQKVEVFGGQLDELTIGNHVFTNMQTILTGL